MRIRSLPSPRAGFTLVELLVSMSLIILIMSILSEAFVEGLDSVRKLKAIGDMQENLRCIVPLRDDLLQRHFTGTQKLSVDFANGARPEQGFFRIEQLAPHNVPLVQLEGSDSANSNLLSYRITQDRLHLTVANVGARRTDYLTAAAPTAMAGGSFPNPNPSRWLWAEGPPDYQQAGTMNSQWAEVMWFLMPMIDPDTNLQMTAGASSTPLWNLHRRQRLLVVANATTLNTVDRISCRTPSNDNLGRFPEIACKVDPSNNSFLYFPTPTDMSGTGGRTMMDATGTFCAPYAMGTPYPAGSAAALLGNVVPESVALRGDDRVIPDVISFEIKVLFPGSFQFQEIRAVNPSGIYDTATWSNPTIRAVQIIIRVWDARTEQTRQMTLIQDM